MGATRILTEHWPVVLHVSEGNPTDAEVDTYIQEATAILLRGEPHAVVMDASALTEASPYSRARKKAWLAEHESLLRKHCVATAVVLKSPVLRFISSMVMLVVPFPTPYRVFDSAEDAITWARSHLPPT
ncbi:MAG: hypothetical protein L0Y66_27660 [Myxococcaceae bacterium]|nr:hypothetical protein [Myxococcaceae bacterium]